MVHMHARTTGKICVKLFSKIKNSSYLQSPPSHVGRLKEDINKEI
jgi:hypothetical protein